jgi:mitochondrial fission protein ELM1
LNAPIHILIISDGKAGHENQSLGLTEAMSRQAPVETYILRLDSGKGPIGRIQQALKESQEFHKPDYVISAGHGTHLSLFWVARKYGARSIVLMKPGFPVCWFDWCVAPEHDFKIPPTARNLIVSKGALNRVIPSPAEKAKKLFLIGGASKTHGFDEVRLIEQIRQHATSWGWQVADSRRTPAGFLEKLSEQVSGLELFPHQQTKGGWLASKLASVEEVWVTEDSVSMIYEALTGGARVGVLEMPRLKPDARVIRGLEKLRAEGYFIGGQKNSVDPLAEADRCARLILADEK